MSDCQRCAADMEFAWKLALLYSLAAHFVVLLYIYNIHYYCCGLLLFFYYYRHRQGGGKKRRKEEEKKKKNFFFFCSVFLLVVRTCCAQSGPSIGFLEKKTASDCTVE
jgi:hypothetical protein